MNGARPRGRPPGVRNRPRQPAQDGRLVLQPFSTIEAVDMRFAADWAGVTLKCMRGWCDHHGLGRMVAGRWQASRLALPMWLEGDRAALALYHGGDRSSGRVMDYWDRMMVPRAFWPKCEETKET